MTPEQENLNAAIEGLEAQRSHLGDVVVEIALASLKERLAELQGASATEKTSAETQQALRQVTILFLDVVGSTAFSRDLDPEEIHDVMDGVLRRCTGIVESHEGKVLNYAGDCILAVFGGDRSREDDPERAIRCGLDLLAEGAVSGADIERRYGHSGFNIRVGVHTGGVLLGGGVDGAETIRGSSVNLAARMEQSASPGKMRISHDTYRHVRGVFDVEPQPPIEVKGYDQPILTYFVKRAKPRAFRIPSRGIEGVETRMVGRNADLLRLQEVFGRIYQPGAGLEPVVVMGDVGVGKSRLLHEFESWAESRAEAFYLFRGRATPQTLNQPYGLLRDILAWRVQIYDGDTMSVAKRKLEEVIVPLFVEEIGAEEAQAHAHVLGQMIGLDFSNSKYVIGIKDDARQIRNRGFHVVARSLRRIRETERSPSPAPIVMLLDDLHWADAASLDFLQYLARVNDDVPMLLLVLTRPTLFERIAAEKSVLFMKALRINLAPLDKGTSDELVTELLKRLPEVPEALRDLLTRGAEGNPFYMEELVKMLVDEGAIVAHPEQWTLSTAKLLATKVPPTLTGVLQARLDGLPASEKHALQLASVIGIHFWDETLAHIEPAATEQLPPLQGRELVLPQGDLGKDTREYAFKHQVLQQVTYDTVLRSPRRAAHARAAEWFAQATGARSRDFLSLAAEHYARAENAEMACEYFARAAEHASANFAHEVTRVYVSRALELANPADPRMRWRLLRMQERTFETEGRLPEQLELLKSLIELAEELDDDSSRSIAANRRAFNALLSGDYATCESESTRAQKIAEAAGNHDLALEAEGVRVAAYALKGDPVAGRALGERALARARSLGFPKVEVVLLHQLSACTQQLSDTQAQLEYTLQGLELARRIGELRNETGLLANLGILHGFLGADAQAQQYLEEALRLSRARGQRQTEGVILAGLAQVLSRLGEDDLAQERARLSLDLFVAMKLDSYQGYALGVLGTVELARGRIAAAKETFERLESLGREIGYTLHVLDAVEGLARVALAQDDEIEAMQCVERLLAEARELAEKEGRGENWFAGPEEHRIRLTLYRVFCRVNDPRAQPALEEAHRRLQIAAAALSNPVLRESFMTQVPEHKEIVRLWELRRQERPMS